MVSLHVLLSKKACMSGTASHCDACLLQLLHCRQHDYVLLVVGSQYMAELIDWPPASHSVVGAKPFVIASTAGSGCH
jgi:hypothetical protein